MKLEAIVTAVFFFIFGMAAVGYFSKKRDESTASNTLTPPPPLQTQPTPPQYIYQPIVYLRRNGLCA